MSRFGEFVSTIPRSAYLVAIAVYLLFMLLVLMLAPHDPKLGASEIVLLASIVPVILAIYALLAAYIYHDAKRRGMNHVVWTLLAVFVPNGIGIILYFLMREPRPQPCPSCGTVVKGKFAFCPSCGAGLNPACPSCRKPVESGWRNCAHCGSALPA
ncbi:MAG: zinc ribbon domain-containing protein [Bryobacteraceae bacterium]|nr:zinc ribbon domain-containing protein [Bryobacteraceae bacterium]